MRRTNLENSPLVLSGGRTGNVRSIGRSTEPRFFANRAVVVGRGERGVVEDERTGDGVTRSVRRQPAHRRHPEHHRGRG